MLIKVDLLSVNQSFRAYLDVNRSQITHEYFTVNMESSLYDVAIETDEGHFMKIKLLLIVIGSILSMGIVRQANAERFVVVNGKRMNNHEIVVLERFHCGYFPDGNYWLNVNTGVWGYAGNLFPQGNITDNCYSSSYRPGLSQRGLLYSPGELLR